MSDDNDEVHASEEFMIFPEKNTWLCAECGKVLAQAYYVDGALLCDGCRKASMKPDRKSYDGSCYVAGMVVGFLVSVPLWITFPDVSVKAVPVGVWIGLGIAGYVGGIFLTAYICGRSKEEFNAGGGSLGNDYTPAILVTIFWPIVTAVLPIIGLVLLAAHIFNIGSKHGGHKE